MSKSDVGGVGASGRGLWLTRGFGLWWRSDMGSDMVSQSVEGIIRQFFQSVWKLPTRFERLE